MTLLRFCLSACLALLGACGGGSPLSDGDTPPTTSDFEIHIDTAANISASRGSSGLLRVRIERKPGFAGKVELQLQAPPEGIVSSVTVSEGPSTEALLSIRIGPDVPLGAANVVVSASGGGQTRSVGVSLDIAAARPRAQALIAAALAVGRIDHPTSLLYRLFAIFDAAALPAEFAGSGSEEEDHEVFELIERDQALLPAAALERMTPFLVRPDDPRSVWSAGVTAERRQSALGSRAVAAGTPVAPDTCPASGSGWISQRSSLYPVRVWALCPGDDVGRVQSRANLFSVMAVVDRVYGKMTDLMGPAIADEWGDDAIDIYIVASSGNLVRHAESLAVEGNRGIAYGQPPVTGGRSSGAVVLPTWRVQESDYFLTVIHELFHVLQFAHNRTVWRHWFTEASATWASFHFNRTAPVNPELSRGLHTERFTNGFQTQTQGLLGVADSNAYFSYVWPLFMEQKGGPEMIAGAWRLSEPVATEAGFNNVLDFLLPFGEYFRVFALRNLNQGIGAADPLPRSQRYVSLEPFFPDPKEPGRAKLKSQDIKAAAKQPLSFGRPIEPLSAVYFRFTVADATVKKVVLDLQGLQGGGLDVDALVMINGTWESTPRNLNGKSELTFCLDDPAEDLWAITLIVSNHQKLAGSQASAEVGFEGSTTPCATVWKGRSTITQEGPGYTQTTVADVVFEFDDALPPGPTQPFRLRSGNYSYNWRSGGQCPITQSASGVMLTVPPNPAVVGSTSARFEVFPTSPLDSLAAVGGTIVDYRETDCRGNTSTGGTAIDWLLIEGPGAFFLSTDGNTAEGSAQTVLPGLTLRAEWSFTRSRQ